MHLISEVSGFCPVSQPGAEESRDSTVPRAELWAHQELLPLYPHRFDSKQGFSKFLLLLYPEHSVHPVQSSKSRHYKESFAATVHLGQHSSNSISWPLGPAKPLFSVPAGCPSHPAVPQHVCVHRVRNELMLAAEVRKVPTRTNLQPPGQLHMDMP